MAAEDISFYNNKDPEHDTYLNDPYVSILSVVAPTVEYCMENNSSWTIPTGKVFKEWNGKRDGTGLSLNPGDSIDVPLASYYAIWEDDPTLVEYITTGAELTSIADAIRTKGGTSSPLSYPEGFISAINDISGSGGGGGDAFADAIIMRTISEYNNSTCSAIANYVFAQYSSLTAASFTACTDIGSSAFYSCLSLTTISFPICTHISDAAFNNCIKLSTIYFPSCITIGTRAFSRCLSLTTVSFPLCTDIGLYAFEGCTNLKTISFPLCTNIGIYAFHSCSSLTTASFPVCTSIRSYAFQFCSSLTTISFPVCTHIGSFAFDYCLSLTTVSFPACTILSANAFRSCINLETARFSVCGTIYSSAFKDCSKLMSVYFMSTSVVTISAGTASAARPFYSTPMEDSTYTGAFGSIYVPASLVDAYKSASGWSFYSSRIAAYSPPSPHITLKV